MSGACFSNTFNSARIFIRYHGMILLHINSLGHHCLGLANAWPTIYRTEIAANRTETDVGRIKPGSGASF